MNKYIPTSFRVPLSNVTCEIIYHLSLRMSIKCKIGSNHETKNNLSLSTAPLCDLNGEINLLLCNKISPELQIELLFVDDDIIVIHKPCNLRSVPGHANPPPDSTKKPDMKAESESKTLDQQRKYPHKRTIQDVWVCAIKSFSNSMQPSEIRASNEILIFLRCLSEIPDRIISNIPRKPKPFLRFAQRNFKSHFYQKRSLFDCSNCDNGNDSHFSSLVQKAYKVLKTTHASLLEGPQPTSDEESALGQLNILFRHLHNKHNNENKHDQDEEEIWVVHRLDCETSGLMVFARNDHSASILCKSWREKNDKVKKVYLAKVQHWPPYHDNEPPILNGEINLKLSPSKTERIKWEVDEVNGKQSETLWKIWKDDDEKGENLTARLKKQQHVILELQPVTGRTHQLRIHCAAIGSGIIGDSLYGESPIPYFFTSESAVNRDSEELNSNAKAQTTLKCSDCVGDVAFLHLHAYKLSFPHPQSGKIMKFEFPKSWV